MIIMIAVVDVNVTEVGDGNQGHVDLLNLETCNFFVTLTISADTLCCFPPAEARQNEYGPAARH